MQILNILKITAIILDANIMAFFSLEEKERKIEQSK